ncbi:unnamed protein product [Paramecium sonneborni]|uniref:Uncharacterized protein n=1 Tax=Paramecium sonneborni TaxID=65129 RepID=A0A8S1MPU0_9CILI|nr:unnamed protein product [Paramecium sonneborni]
MIFDLQPPSPSLSPNSRVRYYQEQLDKAHEIIDQLEILLHEKELQKSQTNHPSNCQVFIPPLSFHSKSPSINGERSKSYVATPQQYSTPRDPRNRMSMGNQSSIKYIEEMKTRHTELVQQFKEDNSYKELKNKEINDHIQELKTELIYCQQKQTITKKEKIQSQQQLEHLQNEIENIQYQLNNSKQQGLLLYQKLQQFKQNNQDTEFQEEESEKNHKLATPQSQQNSKFKNSTSHKKLMQTLQQEIELLEAQKQQYFNTSVSNFEEKEIETNHFNDRIIESKQQNLRIDTLDDVRLVTDSGYKLFTQVDQDNESVKSFKIKKQKPRSCESCIIF